MKSKSIFLLAFLFCSSVVPVKSDSGAWLFHTPKKYNCNASISRITTTSLTFGEWEASIGVIIKGIWVGADFATIPGVTTTIAIKIIGFPGHRDGCGFGSIDPCDPWKEQDCVLDRDEARRLDGIIGTKDLLGGAGGGLQQLDPDVHYH